MPLLSSCHDHHGVIIIEEHSDEAVASTFTPTGYNMRSPRARHEKPRKRYNQFSPQSRGNHGLWLNDFEGSRCGNERLLYHERNDSFTSSNARRHEQKIQSHAACRVTLTVGIVL